MAFSLLRSNNFVPPEVEIMNEIADLKKRLSAAGEDEQKAITKKIEEKTLALRLTIEKRRR